MIDPIRTRASLVTSTAPVAAPIDPATDRKLRETAKQLEGLFVQQLFKAMRDTVPQQDGIVSANAGEDMFTGLMDQHLAAETPSQWEGGLAESVYRQLRGRVAAATPQPSSSTDR
ncbi:rod-binding protein [Gemmatimonas sp.]